MSIQNNFDEVEKNRKRNYQIVLEIVTGFVLGLRGHLKIKIGNKSNVN